MDKLELLEILDQRIEDCMEFYKDADEGEDKSYFGGGLYELNVLKKIILNSYNMLEMKCNHCKCKFLYEKTFISDLDPDIISDDYYIICLNCERTDQSYSAYRFDNFTVLEDVNNGN